MSNTVNKAGATGKHIYLINNTHADLIANLGVCQLGIETDTGLFAYKDQAGAYHNNQPLAANLTSLVGLSYVSGSPFVKMTGVATFSLDTATYQPLASNLTTIGGLANATGWLHNNGSGTFAYSTPSASDVGADASGAAATVQGNLTTHIGLTGTSVHGLGTAATHAASDFQAAGSYQPLNSNLTTIAGITPVRGGLIVANATPEYAALALGGASGSILTRNATDPGWSAYYLAGTAGQTYTFPSTTASIVGGSGTQFWVPLWGSGGAVLGNSLIQQDASATAVIIGDNLNSRKFNVRYNPGGTSAAGMDFGHSGTGGATLGILATATGHGWGGGKIVFYDDVNGHALQVLDCNSGNIWIGGTSAATAPVLYVNGNGQVSIGGAPTSTHAFDIYKTGTAVYMAVGDLSSTGPLFYVGSDGTNAYLMSRNNQPLAFGHNNASTQLIIGTSGQLTASYYSTGILHSSAAGLISSSLIVATDVTTNTLTYACLQQVSATSRVLGRITAGAGNIEELTAANLKTICGYYTSGDNPSFAGLTISGFAFAGVLQNAVMTGVLSSHACGNTYLQMGNSSGQLADTTIYQTLGDPTIIFGQNAGNSFSFQAAAGGATKYATFLATNNDAGSIQMVSYGTTFAGTSCGISNNNLSRVYASATAMLIDVYGTYPLYLGANSLVYVKVLPASSEVTIEDGTNVLAYFQGGQVGNNYLQTGNGTKNCDLRVNGDAFLTNFGAAGTIFKTANIGFNGKLVACTNLQDVAYMPLAVVNTGVIPCGGATNSGLVASVLSQNAGSDLILTQNNFAAFTSVAAGAVANTLYLKAGAVGMQVTPQTWSTSYAPLQVGGLGSVFGAVAASAGNGFYSSGNAYLGTGNIWKNIIDDPTSIYVQYSGNHAWTCNASPGAGGTTFTPTVMMICTTTGLGIGNTAPGNTLTLGTAGNGTASFGIADVQTTSAGTSNLTPTCSRINITATGTYTLLTGSLPIGTLIFIYNATGSAPTIRGYYHTITLNSYTFVWAIKDENGNWELQMPAV